MNKFLASLFAIALAVFFTAAFAGPHLLSVDSVDNIITISIIFAGGIAGFLLVSLSVTMSNEPGAQLAAIPGMFLVLMFAFVGPSFGHQLAYGWNHTCMSLDNKDRFATMNQMHERVGVVIANNDSLESNSPYMFVDFGHEGGVRFFAIRKAQRILGGSVVTIDRKAISDDSVFQGPLAPKSLLGVKAKGV